MCRVPAQAGTFPKPACISGRGPCLRRGARTRESPAARPAEGLPGEKNERPARGCRISCPDSTTLWVFQSRKKSRRDLMPPAEGFRSSLRCDGTEPYRGGQPLRTFGLSAGTPAPVVSRAHVLQERKPRDGPSAALASHGDAGGIAEASCCRKAVFLGVGGVPAQAGTCSRNHRVPASAGTSHKATKTQRVRTNPCLGRDLLRGHPFTSPPLAGEPKALRSNSGSRGGGLRQGSARLLIPLTAMAALADQRQLMLLRASIHDILPI